MRTVIFDLDGTLVDTGADLIAAANACFRGLGHGDMLDLATDRGVALRGGRAMLTLGFERLGSGGEAEIDAQYPLLLKHYGADIASHSRLYPGVEEALDSLDVAGFAVGICTNKPEALAEQLMTCLGARARFGALVGADTLPVRKPDPAPFVETVRRAGGDPARALLVGDTVTDRETARAAGVPCILVTFGPDGDRMAALAPEALLATYDELPDLAERLLPDRTS